MNFFYEEPAIDMRDDNTSKDNNSYRVILPYTPAIYELLSEYKNPNRFKSTGDVTW